VLVWLAGLAGAGALADADTLGRLLTAAGVLGIGALIVLGASRGALKSLAAERR
jgi:hypothetical protein